MATRLARFEMDVRNPARLVGHARRYEKLNEDGLDLGTETTLVQVRVADQLTDLKEAFAGLLDVEATKDRANCDARVDVQLDGQDEPFLTDVPVTHLLFLEKELTSLRKLVAGLPTNDPAEQWTWDATSNSWKSGESVTLKPQKMLQSMITAPATDKFPAQTHVYSEDRVVGQWHTVKFSGALQADRIRQLLDRINLLLEAVKRAREEANSREVTWVETGNVVLDYVFAE